MLNRKSPKSQENKENEDFHAESSVEDADNSIHSQDAVEDISMETDVNMSSPPLDLSGNSDVASLPVLERFDTPTVESSRERMDDKAPELILRR